MKKKLLLCIGFLCLLFSFRSRAQSVFAPIGAEWWYYSHDVVFDESAYMLLHCRATQDTAINGQACRAIVQEGIKKRAKQMGNQDIIFPASTVPFRTLYVYDNTDTVFIYNELFERFTPLYIYNVTAGQTVCLPVILNLIDVVHINTPVFTDDSTFCYVVDSVVTTLYDTSHLKTIYSHSLHGDSAWSFCNWSFADYNDPGIYAQTIGGVHGGILPNSQYNRGASDFLDYTAAMQLNCYRDSMRNIKVTESDCDFLPATTLSVPARAAFQAGISVYPNPADGFLHIKLDKALADDVYIRFADLSGKEIRKILLPAGHMSQEINTGNISDGLYLLELQAGGQKSYQKIFIHH